MGKGLIISLGISVGAQLLSALLAPKRQQPQVDLSVQKSSYGTPIPKVWGRFRLAGNIVWAPKLKKRRRSKKRGGKKGNQSYEGSAFSLMCEGPVVGFNKIWHNRKLKGDNLLGSNSHSNSRFIRGTATQGRDSLIQSVEGTGNSFGFRHRAGLVIDALPLAEHGERLPQIEAEVITAAVGNQPVPVPLSQIISEISERVGIPPAILDLTEVESIQVVGAILRQQSDAANFLSELRQVYFFDVVQSGWGIKFIRQERPGITLDIPNDHIGTGEYNSKPAQRYTERRIDPLQLPRKVTVTYVDLDRNYETNTAQSFRDSGGSDNEVNVTVPVVLNACQAKRVAERLNHLPWIQQREIKLFLPALKYAGLEVGDVVSLELESTNDQWQITKLNWGANLVLELEAKYYGGVDAVFQAPPTGGGGSAPIVVEPSNPGSASLQVLDIPLVEDAQGAFTLPVIVSGSNWQGATLYLSRDNGASFQFAQVIGSESIHGTCQTTLANYAGAFDTLDSTSTLRVQLANTVTGELETITEARMRNGENVALVGNEIVRFRTATLISPGVYDLTGLLRGRRGTDWARAGHAANERFVLLSADDLQLEYVQLEAADLGKTLQFKALVTGEEIEDVAAASLNYAGVALECYSPINLGATKDNAGNIALTWTRRDRKAGDRTDYAAFPMSEVVESYEVEIRNAADTATLRTLTSNSPTIRYTAADQVTDFGSAQSTVRVRAYQLSALVGRGYTATATLTPSTVATTPIITDFSPRAGAIGESVTIYGSGFTGATSGAINGTPLTVFGVTSDTQASGVIAAGTTSGLVSITTPGGTATSAAGFVMSTGGSGYTNEQAQDAAAAALVAGQNNGIVATYDDANNRINLSLPNSNQPRLLGCDANGNWGLVTVGSGLAYQGGVLSVSGGGGGASVNLVYQSDGDTNGLFYYAGTQRLSIPWINPVPTYIYGVMSSGIWQTFPNNTDWTIDKATNRGGSIPAHTDDIPNQWMGFKLPDGETIDINAYTLRSRPDFAGFYAINWVIEISNNVAQNSLASFNAATWNFLHSVSNETFTSTNQWKKYDCTGTAANAFRIRNTGNNSNGTPGMAIGELEFYGVYRR